MKIAIVGAGNVGATLAMRVAEKGLADVTLVDVKEGIAKAKSHDLSDAAPLLRHESKIEGTEALNGIAGSSLVVVTAGFPRKPGMKREELLAKNKAIVGAVAESIKVNAPGAIIIVVTNPLDIMTHIAFKVSGFQKNRVFGMAGDLDASRFATLIAEKLDVKRSSIEAIVMGSHGDSMVPIITHTKVSGKPLSHAASQHDIEELIARTKARGAEIVSLLGQGSAYYAPSAAVLTIIESIVRDTKKIHCVSAVLEGEYGARDICVGVPAKIGRNGVEEIVEIDLSPEEQTAFERSVRAIQKNLQLVAET
jgi:malate dehydrogenase